MIKRYTQDLMARARLHSDRKAGQQAEAAAATRAALDDAAAYMATESARIMPEAEAEDAA